MKIDVKSFFKKWFKPEPNQFPTGSRVYKGFQGQGKTLSMVKYTLDLVQEFPDSVIFSNIKIKDLEPLEYEKKCADNGDIYYQKIRGNYKFIENDDVLKHALLFRNGKGGVLVLLDEAHLFFNKKSGISLDVLTAISQQRKDRKRLVFSSQIWEELDISLRKQVKEIVSCRCYFGRFQINRVSDGETLSYNKLTNEYECSKLYTDIFKHYQLLYDRYDTYQKIISNREYHREFSAQNYNIIEREKGSR